MRPSCQEHKDFLQVLDELNELGIQFLSQREAIDTEGPLGRAIVVIISAIAELERSLKVERSALACAE
jgi:DNA invertase Pin-like site-specific DNA recombinase